MMICNACRHFAYTSTSNFRVVGVCNFKKGAEKIQEHGCSESDAFAMEKWRQLRRNTTKGQSVLTLLDDAHTKLVKVNRHYLGCVITTVLMSAKQGIALRGHRETAAATE